MGQAARLGYANHGALWRQVRVELEALVAAGRVVVVDGADGRRYRLVDAEQPEAAAA